MLRQIMVPLDGSRQAEQALPEAAYLAALAGATLHLVRVVEVPSAVRINGLAVAVNVCEGVIAAQRQEAARYLERVRARLAEYGLKVIARQMDGDAARALLDYARIAEIDLIVMATHGRRALRRWVMGSVAGQIAQGGTAVLLLRASPAARRKRAA
jgi:nucleotide-binding universal stress UspA family protein